MERPLAKGPAPPGFFDRRFERLAPDFRAHVQMHQMLGHGPAGGFLAPLELRLRQALCQFTNFLLDALELALVLRQLRVERLASCIPDVGHGLLHLYLYSEPAEACAPTWGVHWASDMRILLVICLCAAAQAQESLQVTAGLGGMLERHLTSLAKAAWEQRAARVAPIRTPAEEAARQASIRGTVMEELGGFPPKTPLHARTTGTLAREGYRVEKVIYESQPGYLVTANLYVPAGGAGPVPGGPGPDGPRARRAALARFRRCWALRDTAPGGRRTHSTSGCGSRWRGADSWCWPWIRQDRASAWSTSTRRPASRAWEPAARASTPWRAFNACWPEPASGATNCGTTSAGWITC